MKRFLLACLILFALPKLSVAQDFLDYPWLNKRLPLDTLFSYEGDTLIPFQSDSIYVINLWYAGCPPCLVEMPSLNKLKADFAQEKVVFLALSFNTEADLKEVLENNPFHFRHFHLSRDEIIQKRLSLGYPTHLIVDANGIVRFQKSGGHTDPAKAQEIHQILSNELKAILEP